MGFTYIAARVGLLSLAVSGLMACTSTAEKRSPAPQSMAAEASGRTPFAETGDPLIDGWVRDAAQTMAARRAIAPVGDRAKNVILFIGDGMDPTTITAARIYEGQQRGEDGEENFLAFETLPHLALAKTYTTNSQTPDSAGTATAMLSGVKTKSGVVGLTDAADYNDCETASGAIVPTLAELAEKRGLATGIISTARLTHATPASVYAHSANRNWEDSSQLGDPAAAAGCIDIARQLIEFSHGDGIDLAMGGGRRHFLPADMADPENPDMTGRRDDGRNLVQEWTARSGSHRYIWNEAQFAAINPADDPRVLALFEPSHLKYELDRADDEAGEPSLAEMTAKAIDILSRDEDGFFLMVEAGRVDHAHHGGNAARALADTVALSDAVRTAARKTSAADTLIIVTADHGHTINFQGYPKKGNDILGLVSAPDDRYNDDDGYSRAADGKRYTTLGYGNGPGAYTGLPGYEHDEDHDHKRGIRPDPSPEDVADINYKQQAAVPLGSETHGGQDVTIYASGPAAHLFGGTVEQTYIYYVMREALGL